VIGNYIESTTIERDRLRQLLLINGYKFSVQHLHPLLSKSFRTVSTFVWGKFSLMGSLNICASQEESPDFLRGKLQAKMEAIQRLQAVGLTDEPIAKCLDMTLEEFRQVDLTE